MKAIVQKISWITFSAWIIGVCCFAFGFYCARSRDITDALDAATFVARSAAYKTYADKLLELIKECKN